MSLIRSVHEKVVSGRRVKTLAAIISDLLPKQAMVLDVGCGDGLVDRLILEQRPDVSITGIDVLIRRTSHLSVIPFDGVSLPFKDGIFNAVLFIDVLHHTEMMLPLLREAVRVSNGSLIIKDHLANNRLDTYVLRLMDWIGNAPHGVLLPYNYLSRGSWTNLFSGLDLEPLAWRDRLHLYNRPLTWGFDRSLHFVAKLRVPHH